MKITPKQLEELTDKHIDVKVLREARTALAPLLADRMVVHRKSDQRGLPVCHLPAYTVYRAVEIELAQAEKALIEAGLEIEETVPAERRAAISTAPAKESAS